MDRDGDGKLFVFLSCSSTRGVEDPRLWRCFDLDGFDANHAERWSPMSWLSCAKVSKSSGISVC